MIIVSSMNRLILVLLLSIGCAHPNPSTQPVSQQASDEDKAVHNGLYLGLDHPDWEKFCVQNPSGTFSCLTAGEVRRFVSGSRKATVEGPF